MTKRKNQIYDFALVGNKGLYFVTIESLKNSPSGCPNYKAIIIKTEENAQGKLVAIDGRDHYNAVYTFKGHYLNALGEARWTLDHYESEAE